MRKERNYRNGARETEIEHKNYRNGDILVIETKMQRKTDSKIERKRGKTD